jgi:hypothetical protein
MIALAVADVLEGRSQSQNLNRLRDSRKIWSFGEIIYLQGVDATQLKSKLV